MAVSRETSRTNRHVSGSEHQNSLARSRALCPTLLKRMSIRPKASRGLGDGVRDLLVRGAVDGKGNGPLPMLADRFGRPLHSLGVEVDQNDVGALPGKAPGRRVADAMAGACHHC